MHVKVLASTNWWLMDFGVIHLIRGRNSSLWWFLCPLFSQVESHPSQRKLWLLLHLEPSYLTVGCVSKGFEIQFPCQSKLWPHVSDIETGYHGISGECTWHRNSWMVVNLNFQGACSSQSWNHTCLRLLDDNKNISNFKIPSQLKSETFGSWLVSISKPCKRITFWPSLGN